MAIEDWLIMFT